MKKNFLKVAALLIAAMLMVVSCTQEVAPVNNGLVDAKLNVAYGRDLTVSGDTNQDGLILQYKMEPKWSITNASEVIYGGTKNAQNARYEFKTYPEGGNLGYVTPGLWQIEVKAYGKDNAENAQNKEIFYGVANVYFNDTTEKATVFLAPVNDEASAKNSISFNFKMQDLSDDMASNYEVKYSISKIGSDVKSDSIRRSPDSTGNVGNYVVTVSDLDSGFYTVNVSIHNKKTGALVGGTTKGFLMANGATVTIGGNIEPSDYEKVSINTYYVNVKTDFNHVTSDKFNADQVSYYTKEDGSKYAKINVSISDTTNSSGNMMGSGYTVTNYWTAVSDGKDNATQNNSNSCGFEFASGGYKNVTCTTIYSIIGSSTGGESSTYYFANTVTAQVYVDPVKLANATQTESSGASNE
ncbi:MAG: hypothetical protein MSS69_08745 [Spirochaetales bacterium]|nr:hypothetical protein [Spirochaetales bacterium]